MSGIARSTAIPEALWGAREPRFSDETAALLRFSEAINFMVVPQEKFASFSTLPIIDPRAGTQVGITISRTSRQGVNRSVEAAVAAGGTADPSPQMDHGDLMYTRSVADPDGHVFDLMWMSQDVVERGASAMTEIEESGQ